MPSFCFKKNSLKLVHMEFSSYYWENLGVNFQPSSHQIRYMMVLNLRTRLKIKMKTKSPYEKCPTLVERWACQFDMGPFSMCKNYIFFLMYLENALPLKVVSIMFCKAYHHFSGILIKRVWFLPCTHHWYGAHLNLASPWPLLL